MAEDDEGDASGNDGDAPAPVPQEPAAGPAGLALAAVIVGISSVLLSAAAWAVWLSARLTTSAAPGFASPAAYEPMSTGAPMQLIVPLGQAGVLVALAAGAVWCLMLPASTVGVVLARLAARHHHDAVSRRASRAATGTAVVALLLALAGTALFCFTLFDAAAGLPGIYRFAG